MDQIIDMRNAFIESAVHIVAQEGMDRATTKNISKVTGYNEAYIYRCFDSKETLLREAFHLVDVRFLTMLQSIRPIMKDESLAWEERCRRLWQSVWYFMLKSPEDYCFYIRYYYSGNYVRCAKEEHLEVFKNLPGEVAWAFKSKDRLMTILRQLYDNTLCFFNRVMDGELPNDEATCEFLFQQVYAFMLPNFKPEYVGGENE